MQICVDLTFLWGPVYEVSETAMFHKLHEEGEFWRDKELHVRDGNC